MATTPIYGFRYRALTDTPDIAAGTQNLAEDVEAQLARIDNVNGISNVCGTGSTTSSSFVNLPATSSFSFTKRSSSSRLVVDMSLSAFVTGAVSSIDIGLSVNGVDYQLGKLNFNTLLSHLQMAGSHPNVAAGLAAGTYTIQARWRRSGGTGTLNVDPADWISIMAREV